MASKKFNVFLPCYLAKDLHPLFNLPEAVHDCCTVFGSLSAVHKYFEDHYKLYEPIHDIGQRCVYSDYVIDFVPLIKGKISGIIYGYIILSLTY